MLLLQLMTQVSMSYLSYAAIHKDRGLSQDLSMRDLVTGTVTCDGIAFGVGNLTISDTNSSTISYEILQAGPSHTIFGHSCLTVTNDPDFPVLGFFKFNSSYMNCKSYIFDDTDSHVTLYGYVESFATIFPSLWFMSSLFDSIPINRIF
jgi:hypothetical protein